MRRPHPMINSETTHYFPITTRNYESEDSDYYQPDNITLGPSMDDFSGLRQGFNQGWSHSYTNGLGYTRSMSDNFISQRDAVFNNNGFYHGRSYPPAYSYADFRTPYSDVFPHHPQHPYACTRSMWLDDFHPLHRINNSTQSKWQQMSYSNVQNKNDLKTEISATHPAFRANSMDLSRVMSVGAIPSMIGQPQTNYQHIRPTCSNKIRMEEDESSNLFADLTERKKVRRNIVSTKLKELKARTFGKTDKHVSKVEILRMSTSKILDGSRSAADHARKNQELQEKINSIIGEILFELNN
ncbi:hypothetical protein RF11_04290 [Thelohanellus kitauei]|uniref:Uncharacterized protein n=1 Tax=Thelohanellus kitauei TaxID=669202 RepID=A0A0C2MET9_THEKT|nr:hypothetical protein RF11_04290 [Thelohanellus kitauei]